MISAKLRRILAPLVNTPIHPQWLVFRHAQRHKQTVAGHIKGRLLDIGCGNKPLQPWLDHTVEYIGLDYPPTVAKGYQGNADVLGDGQALPFANDCFDAITLLDVMEHLPNPRQTFSEMMRVVRPGGLIITQTPFLYPLHDMPHDFQRWTEPGLKQIASEHQAELLHITAHDHPMVTSAALMSMALASSALKVLSPLHPGALALPILVALIPCVNLLGWIAGAVLPADHFMPSGYTAVFRKRS